MEIKLERNNTFGLLETREDFYERTMFLYEVAWASHQGLAKSEANQDESEHSRLLDIHETYCEMLEHPVYSRGVYIKIFNILVDGWTASRECCEKSYNEYREHTTEAFGIAWEAFEEVINLGTVDFDNFFKVYTSSISNHFTLGVSKRIFESLNKYTNDEFYHKLLKCEEVLNHLRKKYLDTFDSIVNITKNSQDSRNIYTLEYEDCYLDFLDAIDAIKIITESAEAMISPVISMVQRNSFGVEKL